MYWVSNLLHPLIRNDVLRVADILFEQNKLSEDSGIINNAIEEAIPGTVTKHLRARRAGWSLELDWIVDVFVEERLAK